MCLVCLMSGVFVCLMSARVSGELRVFDECPCI